MRGQVFETLRRGRSTWAGSVPDTARSRCNLTPERYRSAISPMRLDAEPFRIRPGADAT